MSGLVQDLRYAGRLFSRSKAFTVVAVAVLALGIGSVTAMYGVVDGLLLQPLPYPDSQRLVRLWARWGNGGTGSVSWPDFVDWRAQAKSLERLTALGFSDDTLVSDGHGERVPGVRVTSDFFALFGVEPALGRAFSADAFARDDEVILDHGVWQRRFGGRADVLGQAITLSGRRYVVVGVMPAGFRLPSGSASPVYLPLVPSAQQAGARGNHWLFVVGRLAPGATLPAARAELDTIGRALAAAYPASNRDRGILVRQWQEALTARLRPMVLLLFGAVLLVLVIACANVANMLLARAAARRPELALRMALGAGRGRLVRQLLTEALVLSLVGGVTGALISSWGVDAAAALLPRDSLLAPHVDARVLGFAALLALSTTILVGLVPALRAVGGDLAADVKDGSRAVTSGRSRLRAALVVLQVGVSFALVLGAALLGKSFARVAGVDPGFDARGVVTLHVNVSPDKDRVAYWRRALAAVRSLPAVTDAGIVDFLPLSQSNTNGDFDIAGKTLTDPNRHTEYMVASPGYFAAMRMHLVRGRGFTDGDTATSAPVCIINQRMAAQYFAGEDPIGKQLRLDSSGPWMTIVGVLGDTSRWSLDSDPVTETWTPYAQASWPQMAMAVRGHGSPTALAAMVQQAVAAVDPAEAPFDVATMSDAVDESLRPRRLLLELAGFFGAAALLLAAVGLYGLLAVQVAQRTRELGIRMALGAAARDVLWLVVRHGLVLALAGVATGALAALALSSLLDKLLFGVRAADPTTWAAVAATLVAVAGLASWLPARRATAIDPIVALRS